MAQKLRKERRKGGKKGRKEKERKSERKEGVRLPSGLALVDLQRSWWKSGKLWMGALLWAQ